MRLAVLHQYSLSGSGSAVYVRELTRQLGSRGHLVRLVSRELCAEQYPFIHAAYVYRDGRWMQEFAGEHPVPRVTSHTIIPDPAPVTYSRGESSTERSYAELSLEQLDEYARSMADRVGEVVDGFGADVLYANHILMNGIIGKLVKERLGLPYVITLHGSDMTYVMDQDQRFVAPSRAAVQAADAIIVLNRELESRLLGLCPEAKEKIVTIPVGVDLDLFRPAPDERGAEAAMKVSLRQDVRGILWGRGPVVAFSGRLLVGKGLHALILAWPQVLARFPEATLLIIGDGPQRAVYESLARSLEAGDAAMFARALDAMEAMAVSEGEGVLRHLRQLRARIDPSSFLAHCPTGIAGRIVFAGLVTHAELAMILPRCSLAVVPSVEKEGFPLVLVEALAAGVPPIATYHGGMRPILDEVGAAMPEWRRIVRVDRRPHHLVPSLVRKITGALARLAEGPAAESAALDCRRIVDPRYGWDPVVAGYEALHERILALSGGTPHQGLSARRVG